MTYKLAKKLKDAGFPFHHLDSKWSKYIFPTLSELINAIGEKRFHTLELFCPSRKKWVVSTKTHECHCKLCQKELKKNPEYLAINWEVVEGRTPEEAVAKLWLKLNKK